MIAGDGMDWIGDIANLFAIITGLVAVGGYGHYRWDQHRKRKELENHLMKEKRDAGDKGQRSLLNLVRDVGMTEAELVQASFRSKHITRTVKKNKETGMADLLLLEWDGPIKPKK